MTDRQRCSSTTTLPTIVKIKTTELARKEGVNVDDCDVNVSELLQFIFKIATNLLLWKTVGK